MRTAVGKWLTLLC